METFQIIVRVPKQNSVDIYFILESNEGLCFYSTLEESEGTSYRDINVQGSVAYFDQAYAILQDFQKMISLEFLTIKKAGHHDK